MSARRWLLLAALLLAALLGATSGRAAQNVAVLLPIVAAPPVPAVSVTFGSGIGADGRLIGIGSSFPAGTSALYYRLETTEAIGLPFQERWQRDGVVQGALAFSGVFAASGVRVSAVGSADGGALPAGRYRLEVSVQGRLATAAEATVGTP